MKNFLSLTAIALTLAACAPNNTISSLEMDFAPATPLGARITGSGKLISSTNGTSQIRLELRGLPANSNLGTGVFVGSCTNQGHLQIELPDIRSDAGGNATLNTSLKNGITPVQAYVNVFQKTQADGYGTALACANLK
jgi:hypothetical protein